MKNLSKSGRARAPQTGLAMTASGGVSPGQRVSRLNRFRENYNPLRGLTMARAVTLVESYSRGEFADLMWTFGAPYMGLECGDSDLMALIERRTSAIGELDWNIKLVDEDRADFDPSLADDQQAALREQYDTIENLYDALEFLALATFRGFGHLEKYLRPDGKICRLEPVDQWNVVRDGMNGAWKYNPEGRQTSFESLPAENLMDPAWFLIREVKRPVNRVALVKAIRSAMGQKNWDFFMEIYGVPGGVVTGPPNVPEDKEAQYRSAAEDIAKGGSGYIPNGANYTPNDGPRGVNPFKDYMDHLQKQLVLAGTGGLLTMLAESGSGTLAGNAHQDTFAKLARAEARKISEVFQKGLDKPQLEKAFPGKPVLAYFDLAANEEQDPGDVLDHAAKAKTAGYRISKDDLEERTGYELQEAAETRPAELEAEGFQMRNRRRGRRILNFDPDQPRDADGKFAETGASGSGGGGDKPLTAEDREKIRAAAEKINSELPELDREDAEFVIAEAEPDDPGTWVDGTLSPNDVDRGLDLQELEDNFDPKDASTWGSDDGEDLQARLEEFDAKDGSTWDGSEKGQELQDRLDEWDDDDASTWGVEGAEDVKDRVENFEEDEPVSWGLDDQKTAALGKDVSDLNDVDPEEPNDWSSFEDPRIKALGEQRDNIVDTEEEEKFDQEHQAQVTAYHQEIQKRFDAEKADAIERNKADEKTLRQMKVGAKKTLRDEYKAERDRVKKDLESQYAAERDHAKKTISDELNGLRSKARERIEGLKKSISNRAPAAAFEQAAGRLLAGEQAAALKPVLGELARILKKPDGQLVKSLKAFRNTLPKKLKALNADPATAKAFERLLGTALVEGLAGNPKRRTS